MPEHIVVLMGGWSAEREVSLQSGGAIADAAQRLGYSVTRLDMTREVAADLARLKPDVVFNALHGTPGEDGSVQGLLEILGLRYTHSGVACSALAMDKQASKAVLASAGIRVPGGMVVESAALAHGDPLPRPYVLKPVNEGSSVGVAIIDASTNAGQPINLASPGPWQDFPRLLAEPFIAGRELTVAVLGNRALGVTELRVTRGFYDYAAKYTDGITRHVLPADIPDDIAEAAQVTALHAHRLLGCHGVSRSDYRWDDSLGPEGLYLLEVNTQPGMTRLSLLPEQAAHVGIGFDELVAMMIQSAEDRA